MNFSNQTILNKTFKVGIYIRLSREDGDKLESESVSNQRDILQRYIKENHHILVDEYITFERPSFERMISDIENQKINMVITKDLSRLGRDYIKTGYYIENYFPENKVRYVAILDGVDTYLDTSNNDVTPFKAIINDMYAKDISKKIKGVLKEKELKGEYLGSYPPFGYKKCITQKNKLEIDTNVAYIIKKIFSTILDKEHIKTPSQYLNMSYQRETWNPKTIRAILVNEAYIGNTVQNKCTSISYKVKKKRKKSPEEYIRVENTHEPIISEELFYKVQDMISSKKSLSTKKHDILLRGLMFCHNCGRKLRICYRKNENIVLDTIRQVCNTYADKNKLRKIYEKCKNNDYMLIEEEQTHLDIIQNNIDELSKKIDKMYLDSVNGIITNTDYFRYSKGFIEERERLKKDLINIKNKIKFLKEKEKSIKNDNEIEKIINEFLKMENPSKSVLYELIDKVELDEYKNIYIYFNFPELNMIDNEIGEPK